MLKPSRSEVCVTLKVHQILYWFPIPTLALNFCSCPHRVHVPEPAELLPCNWLIGRLG